MPSLHPSAVVHPTAIVSPKATVGANVRIGPYCVVEENVTLAANTTLEAHVHIKPYVALGEHCVVGSHAVLGSIPQDTKFKGEETWVRVGAHTRLGEFVTLHRATGAGNETTVGEHCFLMAYVHVGHNTTVGHRVTIANAVQLAGHVVLHDDVVVGGLSAIHQYCIVGRRCMVGGVSGLRQDVPPFTLASGNPGTLMGLNTVGLKRAGLTPEVRKALKLAYRLLFVERCNDTFTERVTHTQATLGHVAEVAEMLAFIQGVSKRGIVLPHRLAKGSIVQAEGGGIEL